MVTPTADLSLGEIESVVRQRAPQLFGLEGPVERVDVDVHHTVFLVDCNFGTDHHRLVVKPQPREVGVGDTWRLWELHRAVRSASDFLAERFVKFLGVDKERDLVFMEYVAGTSLEVMLKNGSGADREVAELFSRYLDRVAATSTRVSGVIVRSAATSSIPASKFWTAGGNTLMSCSICRKNCLKISSTS